MYQTESVAQEAFGAGQFAVDFLIRFTLTCLFLLPLFLFGLCVWQVQKKGEAGWKIASLVLGLLNVVLVFVGLRTAFPPSVRNDPAPRVAAIQVAPKLEALTSSDGSMRLTLPPSWHAAHGLIGHSILEATDEEGRASLAVFTSDKEFYVGPLESYADWWINIYVNGADQAKLVARQNTRLAGYDAVRIDLDTTRDADRITTVIFAFESDRAFYALMGWCRHRDRARALERIRSVMESFESVPK